MFLFLLSRLSLFRAGTPDFSLATLVRTESFFFVQQGQANALLSPLYSHPSTLTISKMVTSYGQRMLAEPVPAERNLYPQRYKGERRLVQRAVSMT